MQIGIDNSEVVYVREKPKSIGNSVTLPYDIRKKEELEEILLALIEQVTYRLRKQEQLACVVNVQLRSRDFKDISHQKKLNEPSSSTKEIYICAKQLLEELFKEGMTIRLVGAKVDNLIQKDELQLSLFENLDNKKQEKLDKTIDKLKDKYGYNTITRAGKLQIENIVNIRKKD